MSYRDNLREVELSLLAFEHDMDQAVLNALEVSGIEAIDHARSLTSEIAPPVKQGEGMRQKHPGGWADVTGQAAASFEQQAEQVRDTLFVLTVLNAAEHAHYLENNGYWVLSGLFEGFIQALLQKHIEAGLNAVAKKHR